MKRIVVALSALLATSAAFAKDCTPVETAPGVKTKPAGCADLGREAPPRRAGDEPRRANDGWVVQRDGTRVKTFGGIGWEADTRR